MSMVNPSDHKITQFKIRAKNLSYKLPIKKSYRECFNLGSSEEAANETDKYILKNVDCEAKPGEMTAVAGPSGAGKTTLLEILAGYICQSKVSGHVLVNDQAMNTMHFRRLSSYVTQDEALFPLLTVEETLIYSARFRLHGSISRATTRATQLLQELGLDHVAGARIGDESKRGISGGEKRRVSIGIALVHDPAVLLLDEPTSGLDSAAALQVMSLLKSMAKTQSKTIILTIHQPGFRIIELFDQVILLSKGIVVHQGTLHLLEERLKIAGHCIPIQVNILEYSIDVNERLLKDMEECNILVNEAKHEEECLEIISFLGHVDENYMLYSNSLLKEVFILCQRFTYNIFRTKQLFSAKITQCIVVGLLLGTIFKNANKDHNIVKLHTRLGFFAFNLSFLLSSSIEALPIFVQERRILMRETSSGAYRIASYVIANTFIFLPFLLVGAICYSTTVYCALFPDIIMGMSFTGGIMGSFFLFSGYFISKDELPKYWKFMHYLSLFKYPFESYLINEFGGDEGNTRCLELTEGACVYGEEFLMNQNLKESQKWSNLGVMLAFILGYRFLSFVVLWYKSYKSRT
ncbi:ABC transporter domain-containing protein [Heracleum sosnowskyi]|uniref:ABC transporter domain-containing protein n=1 Tax=Heracleum sosnowskyi TaxID=360622 RepID=A0AAD8IY04_9APIA|nr:ABC transporter domain-containing protein [Heracleum sosnowskyi]